MRIHQWFRWLTSKLCNGSAGRRVGRSDTDDRDRHKPRMVRDVLKKGSGNVPSTPLGRNNQLRHPTDDLVFVPPAGGEHMTNQLIVDEAHR